MRDGRRDMDRMREELREDMAGGTIWGEDKERDGTEDKRSYYRERWGEGYGKGWRNGYGMRWEKDGGRDQCCGGIRKGMREGRQIDWIIDEYLFVSLMGCLPGWESDCLFVWLKKWQFAWPMGKWLLFDLLTKKARQWMTVCLTE